MANVLDALKNLYLKIGGDKSKLNDNHDISDYVNDIGVALKDAIESSTELPIVSVDDNGKALGVVDGNWGKMSIPTELPAVGSGNNGKFLGIDSNTWKIVANPAPTSALLWSYVYGGTPTSFDIVSTQLKKGANATMEVRNYPINDTPTDLKFAMCGKYSSAPNESYWGYDPIHGYYIVVNSDSTHTITKIT